MNFLSYGGFLWRKMPDIINIQSKKMYSDIKIFNQGEFCNDYGKRINTITIKGEFIGKNALEDYKKAVSLINLKEDLLILPGLEPINALLINFKTDGIFREDYIEYLFYFEECSSLKSKDEYTLVKEGEDLWSVAKRTDFSLDELIRSNPQIREPINLLDGEKVYFP